MRCLNCKYDLRNLPEHRCPECGREFDPNDSTTFTLRHTRNRSGIWALVAIAIIFAIGWTLEWILHVPAAVVAFGAVPIVLIILIVLWLKSEH
jgi:hypothetical protein